MSRPRSRQEITNRDQRTTRGQLRQINTKVTPNKTEHNWPNLRRMWAEASRRRSETLPCPGKTMSQVWKVWALLTRQPEDHIKESASAQSVCQKTTSKRVQVLKAHGMNHISDIRNATSNPTPTVRMRVVSLNGQADIDILPDTGADICAAGPDFVKAVGEHLGNLADSDIVPKTANGQTMKPLGKLPAVKFTLQDKSAVEDVHIYQSVAGALISWSTAQNLGILPDHYPQPISARPTAINALVGNKECLLAEFPTVFDGKIRTMPGEMFHIALKDNARPFCVNTPRTVPFAYKEKLRKEIDLLVTQGIIQAVTEPTEWCVPIVVAPKKNSDKIRMCVDLSELNKYVRRERYPSVTPAEAVADISQSKARFFTVFDALKGYHQIPLDRESQRLTTFITPFGRYMFLRALYGISSISDHYNRRMEEAFSGMEDFRRVVDDVIVFSESKEAHTQHVRAFLERCKEKKISLNAEKLQFCQQQVTFAGFSVTASGYTVGRHITDAISQFPTPSSRSDLRSFFGITNQLSSSSNRLAEVLAPLRPLLSTKNEFLWTADHDGAFVQAKEALTTAPTLAFFNVRKETHLYTDASRLGLGFILLQRANDKDEHWKVIQAGSRFLTDTESRYAIIELECLAVAWAVRKCHIFLSGINHFTINTDHHPLIPILNTHRLDEIENPRLQRL